MVRKIRVSRNGLTQCPSCSTHIKVASVVTETTCPFCHTALSTVRDEAAGLLKSMTDSVIATRSGLIAASLMGLTAVSCASDPGTAPVKDTAVEVQEDVPILPPYGIPPDDIMDTSEPDIPPQPPYGIPADVLDPPDAEPEDVVEPDVPIMPPYGIPPDDVEEPPKPTDTGSTNDSSDVVEPDVPILPPYGIPPDDVGEPPKPTDTSSTDDSSDVVEKDASDAVIIVPLYGMPPQDIEEPSDAKDDASDSSDTTSKVDVQAKDVKPADTQLPVPVYGAPPPPKDAQ